MIIRKWDRALDYPVFLGWWKLHKWEGVPLKMLPDTGFVCTDDAGKQLGAIFIYNDDSTNFSYMEWLICNPRIPARAVSVTVKELVAECTQYADENMRFLTTSVLQAGLVRVYKSLGFEGEEGGMTNLSRGPK